MFESLLESSAWRWPPCDVARTPAYHRDVPEHFTFPVATFVSPLA
ncbi:hypothetical protein BSU04_25725 [Caballeronia sordidicola]|uniref:Uncharacterized protein n=1 Tax=Caballeronia sordidicola TaxID=196367 RepID=A0A226WWR1_CABSO|nr:hypothetical protein BSU04_25725 [Caballeronia sordidicola]